MHFIQFVKYFKLHTVTNYLLYTISLADSVYFITQQDRLDRSKV